MSAPEAPLDASRDSQDGALPRMNATRPLDWSIRRELWENRSLTIAPLAVAGFVLFVLVITTFGLPRKVRALPTMDPARQHLVAASPFSIAPSMIMMTTILVGIFYSLDALYGERRDRSILFWKSLPVSDRTTVLSKAAIPLVVLPLIGLALSFAAQVGVLLWGSVILMASRVSPATWYSHLHLFQMPLTLVYGVFAFALWHAPIYAWLLLVSGWAKRTPLLWAVLPFAVPAAVERAAFNTTHIGSLLRYRFMGAMTSAFDIPPGTAGQHGMVVDRVSQLDPAKFLRTPGLWLGLLLAAAFLAAAVRLRRYREPM
ncbi:MAG: ABC transporter permease [Acidobacteriota bacterium]